MLGEVLGCIDGRLSRPSLSFELVFLGRICPAFPRLLPPPPLWKSSARRTLPARRPFVLADPEGRAVSLPVAFKSASCFPAAHPPPCPGSWRRVAVGLRPVTPSPLARRSPVPYPLTSPGVAPPAALVFPRREPMMPRLSRPGTMGVPAKIEIGAGGLRSRSI